VWITLSGTTFGHAAFYTGAGSAITAVGSVVNSITVDPNNHVISAGFIAEGGVSYGGDGTWITLSGSTFLHTGPSSVTANAGGTGNDYVRYIEWDVYGHVVSGTGGLFTAGDAWISVSGNAWFHQSADTGTPHTISGGSGSACKSITYDDKGHFLSAVFGPV
jgi:hypothetical protein